MCLMSPPTFYKGKLIRPNLQESHLSDHGCSDVNGHAQPRENSHMTLGSATPRCGTLEKPSASSDLSFLICEMGMITDPMQKKLM